MRQVLKEGERWSRRRGRWKGRWPSGGPDRLLKFKLQIFFFFLQNLGGCLKAVC